MNRFTNKNLLKMTLSELEMEVRLIRAELERMESEFNDLIYTNNVKAIQDMSVVLAGKRKVLRDKEYEIEHHPDTIRTFQSRLEEYVRIILNDTLK